MDGGGLLAASTGLRAPITVRFAGAWGMGIASQDLTGDGVPEI